MDVTIELLELPVELFGGLDGPRMSPIDLGLERGERAATPTIGGEGVDRGISRESVLTVCQVLTQGGPDTEALRATGAPGKTVERFSSSSVNRIEIVMRRGSR